MTQAQYEAVMTGNSYNLSATPSNWPNNPNGPVEWVSWDNIQVFLTLLNAQQAGNIPEGWAYVLPTEAQWEYACRAGTTTLYSWGDTITSDDANYDQSDNPVDVGQYSANPWGFFDMHGNVQEWTSDWYGTYGSGSVTDPDGPIRVRPVFFGEGIFGMRVRDCVQPIADTPPRVTTAAARGFRLSFQQVSGSGTGGDGSGTGDTASGTGGDGDTGATGDMATLVRIRAVTTQAREIPAQARVTMTLARAVTTAQALATMTLAQAGMAE